MKLTYLYTLSRCKETKAQEFIWVKYLEDGIFSICVRTNMDLGILSDVITEIELGYM